MSTSASKLSVADFLPSLLYSTGFWMVTGAIPVGLVVALEEHYQLRSDWHWAIIAAAVMTIPVGMIGGLFLLVATLISNGRAREATGIST